uniref:Uncharacterized protein n=1 Tax=Shewanella sp. (strain MR-7) TaxID=60481 RepID=Q0HXM6_SHESR
MLFCCLSQTNFRIVLHGGAKRVIFPLLDFELNENASNIRLTCGFEGQFVQDYLCDSYFKVYTIGY